MDRRALFARVDELAAERGWQDDNLHKSYLLTLVSEREDAREILRRHVQRLRADCNRVEEIIRSENPLLNGLGELQQRPAHVEAAVGTFVAAQRALLSFLDNFPAK